MSVEMRKRTVTERKEKGFHCLIWTPVLLEIRWILIASILCRMISPGIHNNSTSFPLPSSLGLNTPTQIFDHFFKGVFFGHLFFHFLDRVKNGGMVFSAEFISNFKERGIRQFS